VRKQPRPFFDLKCRVAPNAGGIVLLVSIRPKVWPDARKISYRAVLFAAAIFGASVPSAQAQALYADQSFSADLLTIDASGQTTEKGELDVRGGKVRIVPAGNAKDYFIIDIVAESAYLVRPARRVFMDSRQSSRLTQLLVPVDPADPCPQWQHMAKIAGVGGAGAWHCERVGNDMHDGRAEIMYRVTSPAGRVSSIWVDARFRFLARLRDEDGTGFELGTIKEGPQSDGLFELPAGYGKFDPRELIERIKQSDVWVEPPK
jgi:hypothetical protein